MGTADGSSTIVLDKEPGQGDEAQLLQPEQREIGTRQADQLKDTSLDMAGAQVPLLDREDGAEEGKITEVYVELPLVAGNLSRQMVV